MLVMGGVLGAVLLCLSPVSSAEEVTVRVDGLPMTRIEVHGSVEVEITAAPDMSLFVRGPEEQMSPQPFEVREDLLVLGYNREARGQDFRRVRYKLALPRLERLRIAGSADVYLEPREEQKLLLVLDGAGDLRMHELSVSGELDMRVNGSGDVRVGVVEELEVSILGSGDVHYAGDPEKNVTVLGAGSLNHRDR
jgi:hypothetical protein